MNMPEPTIANQRESYLPVALPTIDEAEISEVVDSLRSGWVTTGPKVKQFEADFAEYVGTRNAIAVSSCTGGLHIALTALGIGPGDEVIVPTMTFCATANVVLHLGARPVLIDVGGDGNVLPEAIEAAITERTKAIMIVHFSGLPCDLDPLYALAAQNQLPLVEDSAHVVGASYKDQKIGADSLQSRWPSLRRVTVFSFYATKNMTTGEGGMMTTADDGLAQTMRMLTLHGMSRDAWKRYTSAGSWYYEVVAAGYKDNMTDIQAALGIHQLRRLDDFTATRQRYAEVYDRAFKTIPEIMVPVGQPNRTHCYYVYIIHLNLEQLVIDRAAFIEHLKDANIGTSVHFIPVHLHPLYQENFGYAEGDLPVAESIFNSSISLPLYPRMTDEDVQDVIVAVQNTVARFRI